MSRSRLKAADQQLQSFLCWVLSESWREFWVPWCTLLVCPSFFFPYTFYKLVWSLKYPYHKSSQIHALPIYVRHWRWNPSFGRTGNQWSWVWCRNGSIEHGECLHLASLEDTRWFCSHNSDWSQRRYNFCIVISLICSLWREGSRSPQNNPWTLGSTGCLIGSARLSPHGRSWRNIACKHGQSSRFKGFSCWSQD